MLLLKAIGLAVFFAGVTTLYASHAYEHAKEAVVMVHDSLKNRSKDK